MMAAGPGHTQLHQPQIAPELSVEGPHQAQTAQGTPQALEGIAGIEHFKGVLQRVAAAAVHRRVDLDVAPGEHQQGGAKGLHHLGEHPLHIEHRHRSEIEDALGQHRELLVEVIGQIDRTDGEDRIAGQAHQQHPVIHRHGLGCQGESGR